MTDTIKISRELMPCPHCNGSAEMRLYDCEYFVQCVECFASTVADFQIEDEAAQAWNRRATPPADAADMGGQAGEEVEVRGLQWLDTGHYRKKPPQFGYNPHDWNPLMTVAQHERIVAAFSAQQSAHVSVPRELLERTICRLTHGHEHDKAVRELRALLNGGEA